MRHSIRWLPVYQIYSKTPTPIDSPVLTAPTGWILLPPGDAALTRRVKAAGAHWVVQEKKGRKLFWQVPSYSVFYDLVSLMDADRFAALLTGWLQARAGQLPQALALDGKMIRDHLGVLTLAQHEDGAPQVLAVYDQKEGTPRCEQTVATQQLAQLSALDDKTITAAALHCQKANARSIVEKGGDYLLQIKGNQPALHTQAQALDALKDTPFLSRHPRATAVSKCAPCTPSPSNPTP